MVSKKREGRERDVQGWERGGYSCYKEGAVRGGTPTKVGGCSSYCFVSVSFHVSVILILYLIKYQITSLILYNLLIIKKKVLVEF